jgi:hypothetical protein
MTCAQAAAQELLDALSAKAVEFDEWGPQRARIEDERRACDTPVDFMGLNNRTCRWPLFEGYEPFYEKLSAEHGRAPEAIIAPRMQGAPSSSPRNPGTGTRIPTKPRPMTVPIMFHVKALADVTRGQPPGSRG